MAASITSFEPTASGFVFELSEPVSTAELGLYDTESETEGPADVQVSGSLVGDISGSLIVDGTTGIFVATGGVLAPDSYTVTLRSAANAFNDLADGDLLDGENNGSFPSGNGTAGGDFVTTFSVSSSSVSAVVVGLPDFARGPTQAVQVPASGSGSPLPSGLPVQLSDAAGVTSVALTIEFDPDLLDVTAVQLGADAPQGSQLNFNTVSPGVINVAFFALDPMTAGQADIIDLLASVPEDANYGQAQRLTISNLEINADAITSIADDAVHVVAFAGDANANRRYDAEDARLISRVGTGLDSGFIHDNPTGQATSTSRLYPKIDPIIVGDVTGVDGMTPLDSSDLLRRVVGLPTPNIPALPDSQAPTAINLSSSEVGENAAIGTTVGSLSTSDPDSGDTHTYALVAGAGDADNTSFTISGDSLQTAAVFNQTTKDTYLVRIRTTDSTGRSLERAFTISVTDSNVAPTAINLSNSTIAENISVGSLIGSLSTTDADSGDTHTYTLVSVDGNVNDTSFTISGNALRLGTPLDFETKDSFSVRIRTTDQGGLFVEQTLNVQVTDANEAPTALELSDSTIMDDSTAGTVVGNLSTSDVDANDTHTYSLVAGTGDVNNAAFSIVGDQLRAATTIDFSSQTSYSVRVRSTDAQGLSVERVLTITEAFANLAPTSIFLVGDSVAENENSGTVVGTLSTADANATDTHTYSLVTGEGDDDNASFAVSGNQIVTATGLDFESQEVYLIRVRSVDQGGLQVERILTVRATDVNEGASALTLSSSHVADGQASGTVVGTLGSNDPDIGDSMTYTLVSGQGDADNASFTINGDQLVTSFAANQSAKNSYSVRVRAVDGSGLDTELAFAITVTSTNVGPTEVELDSSSIEENLEIDSEVGELSSTDANNDDSHVYELVTGTGDTGNASFKIDGDRLIASETFDFETKASFSVRIKTTDTFGASFERAFTISITDENDAPTAISVTNNTVAENAAAGTTAVTLGTTDVDSGDTHTYTLVAGDGDADNAQFVINGDKLNTANALDFETEDTYSVRVRSTDSDGLTFERVVTVTITNVNEVATALTLTPAHVADGQPSGSVVGVLAGNDPDSGDSLTYTLVAGQGDTDNASFSVSGDTLRTSFAADQSTKSSYTVRVRVTDGDGLSFEESFTVSVTEANVAPTAIILDSSMIDENVDVGTLIGTFDTTDANTSDLHTYEFVAGTGATDNTLFEIRGDKIHTASALDFETRNSYSVRVQSTDSSGASFERSFAITVNDVNEEPTTLTLNGTTVDENSAAGTTIGTFTTTDSDAGDNHTYALVSGDGDADNHLFTVSGSSLVTTASLDFESQEDYLIRVQSSDGDGLTVERELVISVIDVDEAPNALTISRSDIAENQPSGTEVGVLATDDPDGQSSFIYSLVSGTGDSDNNSFAIQNGRLVSAAVFDDAIKDMYSVRIRTQDPDGLTFDQVFSISVTEQNVAPTAVLLSVSSVSRSASVGTVVGVLSTTDANASDQHSYRFVSGNGDSGNATFSIVDNELRTAAAIGSGVNTFSVRVLSEDRYGLEFEQVLTITVQG